MSEPELRSAYPLYWPAGRPRSATRKTNYSFRTSFASARDNCLREIKLLGGTDVIISTNVRTNKQGIPAGVEWGHQLKADNGVAVYFTRKGKEMCFACDCWVHVQDNMQAIALTIAALRGIARWGTGDMMEAAFRGFAALPGIGQTSGVTWWKTLGVTINATPDQVREAYRQLIKKHHPDAGGDPEMFGRLQEAWRQFETQHEQSV